MTPAIWYSGKEETMEIIKKNSGGQERGGAILCSTGSSGQWNCSIWYDNGINKSLYMLKRIGQTTSRVNSNVNYRLIMCQCRLLIYNKCISVSVCWQWEGCTLCSQGVYEDSTSYLILYEPKIVFKFFINRAKDLARLVQCLPGM